MSGTGDLSLFTTDELFAEIENRFKSVVLVWCMDVTPKISRCGYHRSNGGAHAALGLLEYAHHMILKDEFQEEES